MNTFALLIIDMQQALIDACPYRYDEVCTNISRLLDAARTHGISVVHIRHHTATGAFVHGSAGWQTDPALSHRENEAVFDKTFNSAFKQTGLRAFLDEKGLKQLIIVGMQTEYCIETTVRVAFEYGYEVFVPQMSNTTLDTEYCSGADLYRHHNCDIIANRFAATPTVDEMMIQMNF